MNIEMWMSVPATPMTTGLLLEKTIVARLRSSQTREKLMLSGSKFLPAIYNVYSF